MSEEFLLDLEMHAVLSLRVSLHTKPAPMTRIPTPTPNRAAERFRSWRLVASRDYRGVAGVAAHARGHSARASSSPEPVVVELKVEGMMCAGCAENVTKRLMNNTKGVNVAAVDVDLDTKIVKVSIDCESVVDGVTKLPALVESVQEDGGFDAEPMFG